MTTCLPEYVDRTPNSQPPIFLNSQNTQEEMILMLPIV